MAAGTTIPIGTLLHDRYRIAKLLGAGGFGAVYRAWDIRLNIPCAVKENFDSSPAARSQFATEAAILSKLRHPNLPRVTDYFSLPGQGQYLVMDFVEGDDLQEMLDRANGPMPEKQVLQWFDQVFDALQYLHSQTPAVIHRDIKPANIKVTPQGQAILVDFGISKVFTPGLKTTQGARAVTPGFSPQEQYGKGQTDARSDVYAAGATLYNLLSACQPVDSIERTLGNSLPALRSINPLISPQVQSVILKAMELEPAHRFQNIAEFKEALSARPRQKPIFQRAAPLALIAFVIIAAIYFSLGESPGTIKTATPTLKLEAMPAPATRAPVLLAATSTEVKISPSKTRTITASYTSTASITPRPTSTFTPEPTITATRTRLPIQPTATSTRTRVIRTRPPDQNPTKTPVPP